MEEGFCGWASGSSFVFCVEVLIQHNLPSLDKRLYKMKITEWTYYTRLS